VEKKRIKKKKRAKEGSRAAWADTQICANKHQENEGGGEGKKESKKEGKLDNKGDQEGRPYRR